jgi:CDP-glycerol glycerophosphotransferase (TagB/SpsB family)
MYYRIFSIFKKYIKPVIKIALWIVYFFSGLFPRCKKVYVFGSAHDSFIDNAKYLFIALSKKDTSSKLIWITSNNEVISYLRGLGFSAYHKISFPGAYYCLRAGTYFFNIYVTDINFWLSRNSRLINLWHGVPLKKIEHDIDSGPLLKNYCPKNSFDKLKAKVFYPHLSVELFALAVPSKMLVDMFSSAFNISKTKCIVANYPRNEILLKSKKDIINFLGELKEYASLEIIKNINDYNKVYLYMPTWRDSGADFISLSGLDFDVLDSLLHKRNEVFVLKMHPNTKICLDSMWRFKNIKVLNNSIDIYPILPFADTLITDYSSVYIDFLLLNKDIIFFCFDKDCYLSSQRSMYYDYDSVTPGSKAKNFQELLSFISSEKPVDYSVERKMVVEFFYGKENNCSLSDLITGEKFN